METIKDIVEEMRSAPFNWSYPEGIPQAQHDNEKLIDFADRIEQAVTNCDQLKMREALEAVVKVGYPHNFQHEAPHISGYCYEITEAIKQCFAALSAPPRNCDVGSLDEQISRFNAFCENRMCSSGTDRCPFVDSRNCRLTWAQMPYESEKEAR